MAKIPLAQIPNSGFYGSPVLGPRVEGLESSRPVDVSGAIANGRGLSRAQSLLGEAAANISRGADVATAANRGLARKNVDDSVFGDWSGFSAIGEALGFSGRALEGFAQQKMRAKDEVDRSRVSLLFQAALNEHRLAIEEGKLSVDQWVPAWQSERLPKLKAEIDKIGISGRIRREIDTDFIRFGMDTSFDIGRAAIREDNRLGKETILLDARKAADEGRFEESIDAIKRGEGSNLLSGIEAYNEIKAIEAKRQNELVALAIDRDPWKVVEDLQQHKGDGPSEIFDFDLNAIQKTRAVSAANVQIRQRQIALSESIDEGVLTGRITTKEQIRDEAALVDLPEREIRSHIQSLNVEVANTPEAQTKYLESFNDIRVEISNYDSSVDREDEQYYEFLRRIRSEVIPGEREAMLEDLKNTRKEGRTPSKQLRGSLFGTLGKLKEQGLLGDRGLEKDGKTVKDWKKSMAVEQKESELQSSVEKMLSFNPGISPEEANKQFQAIIGREAGDEASRAFQAQQPPKEGWFWGRWKVDPEGWRGIRRNDSAPSIEQEIERRRDKLKKGNDDSASLDESLINFVKGAEGFYASAYGDYKQHSVGYGTRAKNPSEKITKEAADKRLRNELATHAKRVDEAIVESGLALNANQRNALVSFDFNTGDGVELISTSSTVEEIERRLPSWNKVTEGGKLVENKGLINRRSKELELFRS